MRGAGLGNLGMELVWCGNDRQVERLFTQHLAVIGVMLGTALARQARTLGCRVRYRDQSAFRLGGGDLDMPRADKPGADDACTNLMGQR